MTLVLTGGTGFVGREITRVLLAAGHEVRLLLRPSRGRPRIRGASGLQLIEAEFSEPREIAAAIEGARAVLHLVGIISEAGIQTFERVHPGLTGTILTAARSAGIRRFIHMSALGARAEAPARYHQTKWAAEQLVRASGLDWTIFRPSLIYGAGDRFTMMFARLAAFSPALPAIGGGRNLLQPIAVGQVARAFAGALEHSSSIGQAYDLCGPERLEFRQILAAILRATGRRRLVVSLPFAVARLQAAALEIICGSIFQRPPPLNRDQLLMLQEDNVGDGTRADEVFGLHHERFELALEQQFRPR